MPGRMVNEFEYCPRLFYLEWVRPVSMTIPILWWAGMFIAGLIRGEDGSPVR